MPGRPSRRIRGPGTSFHRGSSWRRSLDDRYAPNHCRRLLTSSPHPPSTHCADEPMGGACRNTLVPARTPFYLQVKVVGGSAVWYPHANSSWQVPTQAYPQARMASTWSALPCETPLSSAAISVPQSLLHPSALAPVSTDRSDVSFLLFVVAAGLRVFLFLY